MEISWRPSCIFRSWRVALVSAIPTSFPTDTIFLFIILASSSGGNSFRDFHSAFPIMIALTPQANDPFRGCDNHQAYLFQLYIQRMRKWLSVGSQWTHCEMDLGQDYIYYSPSIYFHYNSGVRGEKGAWQHVGSLGISVNLGQTSNSPQHVQVFQLPHCTIAWVKRYRSLWGRTGRIITGVAGSFLLGTWPLLQEMDCDSENFLRLGNRGKITTLMSDCPQSPQHFSLISLMCTFE